MLSKEVDVKKRFFLRAASNREGATIIEFAIVAPVFFLLIFAILEYGLFMFHKIIIESIVMQTARQVSIGKDSGNPECTAATDRVSYFRCLVEVKTQSLINSELVISQANPVEEGGTYVPDICLDTVPASSAPQECTLFQETNGNPGYQGADAGANVGTAGQVVEVRVVYPWHVQLPFMRRLLPASPGYVATATDTVMITSSTIIKNEPF